MSQLPELSVSQFVAALNQTMEYAYGNVAIFGELANFRVNKNRWVYFDLKDEDARLPVFGSVYSLPGPLEDGMMVKIQGTPRLHPLYGFSVAFSNISPMGSGSIKRLSDLLAQKLEKEGLFAPERKRTLPYPPHRIGLVTSLQSAAFTDFTKILDNRWGGIKIECYDVLVQGEQAPAELIRGLEFFSAQAEPPDVVVMIRGGGSPEDLAAFSNEQVVRAVAGSRVPTLVAIGHERDVSLSELAADRRASTPSNAAELLVPDRMEMIRRLEGIPAEMEWQIERKIKMAENILEEQLKTVPMLLERLIDNHMRKVNEYSVLIDALSPKNVLKRGFAIMRKEGVVSDGRNLEPGNSISIETAKTIVGAGVITLKEV